MTIITEKKEYKGVEFEIKGYYAVDMTEMIVGDRARLVIDVDTIKDDVHEKFLEEIGEIGEKYLREGALSDKREEYLRVGTLSDSEDRCPQEVLADYGPNIVFIKYTCVNSVCFESGKIGRAETENGNQTMDVIEYCFNEFKKDSSFFSFSDILFSFINESRFDGYRCTLLSAKNISVIEEIFEIIVKEK